jgi:hypothetical protein
VRISISWAYSLAALAACGRILFDPVPSPRCSPDLVLADLPAGASLWLPMSRDAAGTIVDAAGGHPVTCTGPCPLEVCGKHGVGLAFSGQEQLRVPWDAALDGSKAYTVAVWARLDEFPPVDPQLGYACAFTEPNASQIQAGDGNSFSLCVGSDQVPYSFTTPGSGSGAADTLTGARIDQPGEWHHLAATWDGRTKTLYIDGVAVTRPGIAIEFDQLPLFVGADNRTNTGKPAYFWNGVLDDVLFYPRVLTVAEIRALAAP